MSIKKLVRISGVINIVVAILLVVSVVLYSKTIENERVAVKRMMDYRELGGQISASSDYLTNMARNYVQFGEKKYLDLYWQEVNETKTRDNVIAKLKEMNTDEMTLGYLQKAVDASVTLVKTEEEAFLAVDRNDYQEARRLMFGDYYETEKARIVAFIGEFNKAVNDKAQQEVDAVRQKCDVYELLSYLSMALIAISVTVSFVLIGKAMRKLRKIIDRFDELATADGDLTSRLEFTSKDEVGDIAKSFNVFVEKVQEIVQAISTSCVVVREQSAAFNVSSTDVSVLSEDIAHAVDDISNGATELAIQVENGVSALNLLSNELDIENDLIMGVKDNSGDVEQLIGHGIENINKLVDCVNKNVAVAGKVAKIIAETNSSTEQISSASDMIKSIAYQTNLLALNAAIEAARAGESGRGFAVVAEEIRKLAENSSAFAEEISNTIDTLVDKTSQAVAAMREAEKIIEQQEAEMKNTNQKFTGIAKANKSVIKMVVELQAMGKTITEEKSKVIATMENLSAISEQSAAATEEISASIAQQTNAIKEVAEGSKKLDHNVDVIQSNLNRFNY